MDKLYKALMAYFAMAEIAFVSPAFVAALKEQVEWLYEEAIAKRKVYPRHQLFYEEKQLIAIARHFDDPAVKATLEELDG